jgi:DNA-binding Lrp family transcriptional regulator
MTSSEALLRRSEQDSAGSLQFRFYFEDPSVTSVTLGAMPNDLRLDDTDRALLEALSEDARIPNSKLAERVGVAPSTALQRVRALRAAGVLRGFHAEVDLAALGRPLQAMVAVRLAVHNREQIETFTNAVRELPGVLTVFHLAGATDYLVWLAAADAQDLREFVVEHLATNPAVAHAETSLIYEHRRGPGIWGAAEPGTQR